MMRRSSLRRALAESEATYQQEQQQRQQQQGQVASGFENLFIMDNVADDTPPSRLSTASARISTAGTAVSRAVTAVIRDIATPLRDAFGYWKRRRVTTAISNEMRPPPNKIGPRPHLETSDCFYLNGTLSDKKLKGTWSDSMGSTGELKWEWEIGDYRDGKYICKGWFELNGDDGNKMKATETLLEFTLVKNSEGGYNLSGNGSNQYGVYSLHGQLINGDYVEMERVYLVEEVVDFWRHDDIMLEEGINVWVKWDNGHYLGKVLAYDAGQGKHLIRYYADEEDIWENLAKVGYSVVDEDDSIDGSSEFDIRDYPFVQEMLNLDVEDEDSKEGDVEDDGSEFELEVSKEGDVEDGDFNYSIEDAKNVAPTTQKKKQPSAKKPADEKGRWTRTRHKKNEAFDDRVFDQNRTVAKCNSNFYKECNCKTCNKLEADLSNCFTQSTAGDKSESHRFYIPIEPSLSAALKFDPEFGDAHDKYTAFLNAEKEVMLKFGMMWTKSASGVKDIPRKFKDAMEDIPITVNGKTYKHMQFYLYKQHKRKALREYDVARKKLLMRLVRDGCKAERETKELVDLINGMNNENGIDFGIEKRSFQSTNTNEMVDSYIDLTKKESTTRDEKVKTRIRGKKKVLNLDLQYAIAFDALVVLMKIAVKTAVKTGQGKETDADGNAGAGKILLRYWKHEIIEKYFRNMASNKVVLYEWEKSKYFHMKTDKWVKGVLRLKLAET